MAGTVVLVARVTEAFEGKGTWAEGRRGGGARGESARNETSG